MPKSVRIALAVAVGDRRSLAAIAGIVAAYGSPSTIAHRTYHSFTGPPTGGQNLNSRLFSLSNNGRTVLWRAAWDEFRAHPVAGGGAGSFQRWWLAHRTSGYLVTDAHNLYAQTLGELGDRRRRTARAVPRAAARRGRARALASARRDRARRLRRLPRPLHRRLGLAGAGRHAARALRRRGARRRRPRREPDRRASRCGGQCAIAIGALAALAAVVAFVGLIGNIALARSEQGAPRRQRARSSSPEAKRAHRWAPWSAQALRRPRRGQDPDREQAGRAGRPAQRRGQGSRRLGDVVRSRVRDHRPERARAVARVRALNPAGPELARLERRSQESSL